MTVKVVVNLNYLTFTIAIVHDVHPHLRLEMINAVLAGQLVCTEQLVSKFYQI